MKPRGPAADSRAHRSGRLALALLAVVILVAALGAGAAAVRAETAPTLSVPTAGIDWAAGTVTVSAAYPVGTSSVVFTAAGATIATVPTDPSADGTSSSGVAVRLNVPTEFTAEGLDAQQVPVWGPVQLTLSPAAYAPSKPKVLLPWRGLVEPRLTMNATFTRPATHASIWVGPDPLTVKPAFVFGADGGVAVSDLRIPHGEQKVSVTVANGFGSASSYRVPVYSLGWRSRLPKSTRFELVDKYSMTLYDVVRRHVVHEWAIAIGTHSTPTPNGYFKIGAAQPGGDGWGVLRRPLYRFGGKRLSASGYYIHGTNEPWSIGMMASHGCVRMFNWEIRAFTKHVPNRTLVLIR